MTTVTNLATGEERTYDLPAEDAIRAAWAQERRDWNTWGYGARPDPIARGRRTVACGNWCAITSEPAGS